MANNYAEDLKAALRGGFNPKTGRVLFGPNKELTTDQSSAIQVQNGLRVMGDVLRKGVNPKSLDVPAWSRKVHAALGSEGDAAALAAKEAPEATNPHMTPRYKGSNKGPVLNSSTFFSDLRDTLQEFDSAEAELYIKQNKASNRSVHTPSDAIKHKKFEDYPEAKKLEPKGPAEGLKAQERAQLLSKSTLNRAKNRAESTEVQRTCLNTINEFALGYQRVDTSKLNLIEVFKPLVERIDEDIDVDIDNVKEEFTTGDIGSTFTTPFLGGAGDETLDHTTFLGPIVSPMHAVEKKKKKRRIKQTAIAMGV